MTFQGALREPHGRLKRALREPEGSVKGHKKHSESLGGGGSLKEASRKPPGSRMGSLMGTVREPPESLKDLYGSPKKAFRDFRGSLSLKRALRKP